MGSRARGKDPDEEIVALSLATPQILAAILIDLQLRRGTPAEVRRA